jgi:hypothetical protein
LRDDALALGIDLPALLARSEWQETRIWCPFCDMHRLLIHRDRATGVLAYRCAGTCPPIVGRSRNPELLGELTSAKSLLTRHLLAMHLRYRQSMATGTLACSRCGGWAALRRYRPEDVGATLPVSRGIYLECPRCGIEDSASLWHLAIDQPEAQRFWRRHPRMHTLPIREIEHAGRPALLGGFQSRDGSARLEMISARDTYEVLRVYGGGDS